MYNPFTLEGKTILVTGASSGIGRVIAIECSKMGAKLIITGRNEERLNETLSQMEGDGHYCIVADLVEKDDIINLMEKIKILDGVVSCAGMVGILSLFQYSSHDKVRNLIDINLISPIELLHLIIKEKKYSKNGLSIVFISSIAGNMCSSPGNAIYCASKAGIVGLTKGMAIELGIKKIRVNAILPGMIETPMIGNLAEQVSQKTLEEDKKRYPLGCYGKPKDVAMGAIYLLSNASEWVTGSNLVIDGGISL